MLICNVSLRPPRLAIAVDIIETATAVAAPAIGQLVLATLVDDPASVRERVDAYLGEIMREAGNAAAAVNAGLTYATAIVEAASAAAVFSGAVPTVLVAAVVEAAAAAALVDSSIVGARFEGILALDGPIMPANPQPTVIYIEG